jgi:uncharacterized paraquat-inducible protein A
MIELTPATAFMLYLLVTLFVLLGLWIFQHYQKRHTSIIPVEKALRTCEFCHFAYLAEDSKAVSRCPCCQSFNKTS